MTPGTAGRLARIDPGAGYGVTTPYTADHTLTSAQSGLWATNEGAMTAVTLDVLPPPAIGDSYTLQRLSAYSFPFRFRPASGHRIEGEAVDKYAELMGPGVMTFEYTRTGVWTITRVTCVWNPEP